MNRILSELGKNNLGIVVRHINYVSKYLCLYNFKFNIKNVKL